ncbi:BEL1-like homeodomain protein 7-like protein [Drosera capensis]
MILLKKERSFCILGGILHSSRRKLQVFHASRADDLYMSCLLSLIEVSYRKRKMATYVTSSSSPMDSVSTMYSRESPGSFQETSFLPSSSTMYFTNLLTSSGKYSEMNSQPVNIDVDASQERVIDDAPSSLCGPMTGSTPFYSADGSSGVSHGQGLSLSLGKQFPVPPSMHLQSVEYQNQIPGRLISDPDPSTLFDPGHGHGPFADDEGYHSSEIRHSKAVRKIMNDGDESLQDDGSAAHHEMPSMGKIIPNSKYLEVVKELLDEVVHVRESIRRRSTEQVPKKNDEGSIDGNADGIDGGEQRDGSSDISPDEKQELQTKLIRLTAMLDEIDRRYKQYSHQMQILVSPFDSVAGSGAAKPYTMLGFQTISCHFRCLRDTVTGQVRLAKKNLGKQETSTSNGGGIARLRYVDQQLRQQKALQQLGILQQHTWRAQRGLPESSVSVLRAWLFEHFLHPYPKESEKTMLAREAGLTRSQVSNWFINARVRLWKPMIEEMYKQEAGDPESETNSPSATEHLGGNRTEDIQEIRTPASA